MKGTIIFRQAIHQALADHNATCWRTYTDKIKTPTTMRTLQYERRVCFYNVKVDADRFEALGKAVAEAGGNMVGIYTRFDGTISFNIRARVSY